MLIPLARGISVLMPNAPKFYPYCICMYIAGEQRAVIDFGAGQKAFNEIDIKSIELGFFTHNHPDHTHSAVLFKHSSLYAAKEEEQSYQSEKDYLDLRGFEYWNLYMPGKALPEPPDATLQNPDIPVEPGFVKIDLAGTITDGQQIELGRGIRMTAIHLPAQMQQQSLRQLNHSPLRLFFLKR
jgi:glyoxylase-like metal-dependent hydrolase (beta-lactamase superfamily II)